QERATAVSFWGFRGPLGAWVCIWGAFAMVTSAPFDNWWHDAYGLDVKILSPPHTVLGLGIVTIQVGALLLTLAAQNRQGEAATPVYMATMLLMIWTLQLFRAEPRLAPVYHPVSSMVPPHFPLLLVCPALALDLLMRRAGSGNDWWLSLLLGATFVLVLLPVQ